MALSPLPPCCAQTEPEHDDDQNAQDDDQSERLAAAGLDAKVLGDEDGDLFNRRVTGPSFL